MKDKTLFQVVKISPRYNRGLDAFKYLLVSKDKDRIIAYGAIFGNG